jgi:hypothetical protein
MGVTRIQYKEDKPGRTTPYPGSPYLPFGAFCVSPRMQGLMNKVGRDTAIIAKMISPDSADDGRDDGRPAYRDSFVVTVGEILKIKGLKRVTSNVGNTADHAAAVEFGSGEGSLGDSSGETRPQGGSNRPQRVLGKAGRIMGDFHGD